MPSAATDTIDGTQRVAALVADHDRHAVLHVSDEAVGGAEIDADDFGIIIASCRLRASQSSRLQGLREASSSAADASPVASRSIVASRLLM